MAPVSAFADQKVSVDLSFLKQRPYKKSKQIVELSSLQTAEDVLVVKDALNPIMRLMVALSYTKNPKFIYEEACTKDGVDNLQFPPVQNSANR